MAECRDLESFLAAYVDEEATPGECARLVAHLETCPPCRDRVSRERAAREVLVKQRSQLRCCASAELRQRCVGVRPAAPVANRHVFAKRRWVPLSMVATLAIAVAGVFFYGLRGGSEALAAQLVVDHVKCFEFASPPTIMPDPHRLGREWAQARGWSLRVPESAPSEELELLGVRRCISTDGITAHMMYKWRGEPLSVYVLNSAHPRVGPTPHLVERMGQETILWSKHGRTYAVVARGRASEVEQIAFHVQRAAE